MALERMTSGGGNFFKPAQHQTDLALLLEFTEIQQNVPTKTYDGEPTVEDRAIGTITVFANTENLENGTPKEIISNAIVNHKALVSDAARNLNKPFVAIVKKVQMGRGMGFAFRGDAESISDETFNKVAGYIEKRDAELAANLAAVPDFD